MTVTLKGKTWTLTLRGAGVILMAVALSLWLLSRAMILMDIYNSFLGSKL